MLQKEWTVSYDDATFCTSSAISRVASFRSFSICVYLELTLDILKFLRIYDLQRSGVLSFQLENFTIQNFQFLLLILQFAAFNFCQFPLPFWEFRPLPIPNFCQFPAASNTQFLQICTFEILLLSVPISCKLLFSQVS